MNHSIGIGLPWGQNSVAYLSRFRAERLLVFVHGFGGSAMKTWNGVETELFADWRAAETDIVFFGYRSFRSQPELAASLLRAFLDDAAGSQRKWKGLVGSIRPDAGGRAYREVLIVAHSLGAPVARRAVLDGLSQRSEWAENARFLLFAPAHLGAYLIKLQKQMQGSFGSLVSTLLAVTKTRIVSLDALEPGSPFLSQLLSDSQSALDDGIVESVRARGVIFGDLDDVVMPGRFLNDPPANVWPGHGHCSICRTDETSAAILELLS